MKSVLVTGATGFIGRNLIELLIKKDIKIYAYVKDNDPGIEWLSKNGVENFIYENDLKKANQFNINTCIHLASYGVKYTDKDVQTMVDVNIKLAAKKFMLEMDATSLLLQAVVLNMVHKKRGRLMKLHCLILKIFMLHLRFLQKQY